VGLKRTHTLEEAYTKPSHMNIDRQEYHRRSMRLEGYDYSLPGAYFITLVTYNRECLFGEVANGEMQVNQYGKIVQRAWMDLPFHYPQVSLDTFVVMPNHVHGIVIINDYGRGGSPTDRNDMSDISIDSGEIIPDAKKTRPYESEGLIIPNGKGRSQTLVMPNHVHGIVIINDYGRGGSPTDRNDMSDISMDSREIIPDAKKTRPYESEGLIIPDGKSGSQTRLYKMMSHGLPEIIRAFKSFSARRINQLRNIHGVAVWQRSYYDHIIRNDRDFRNIWEYIHTNPQKWTEDEFH
jgi:putative transposase